MKKIFAIILAAAIFNINTVTYALASDIDFTQKETVTTENTTGEAQTALSTPTKNNEVQETPTAVQNTTSKTGETPLEPIKSNEVKETPTVIQNTTSEAQTALPTPIKSDEVQETPTAIQNTTSKTGEIPAAIIRKTTPVIKDDAPVWAEYVAPKYRNPRKDFSIKASLSELAIGIFLTELIITSPIGIPMLIHGTTKVKMLSYANRKQIFDEEIAKAKTIEDDKARLKQYKHILKKCHLKESTRKHYAKKAEKAKAKAKKAEQKAIKKAMKNKAKVQN